jgi:DNA-binding MarR family transcriptional regulator
MKQHSNSSLRYQILSTLNRKPVGSVTALAQELKALRSSVSRAVNSLQSAGLIRREGRTLFLTEEGKEEIQRIHATLPIKAEKATDLATRILEQTVESWRQTGAGVDIKALEAIASQQQRLQSTLAIVSQSFQTGAAMRAIQSPQFAATIRASQLTLSTTLVQAMRTYNNIPLRQIQAAFDSIPRRQIQEAISAITQIQKMNLDYIRLRTQQELFPLSHLIIENNVFISRIMVDLDAIGRIIVGLNRPLELLRQQVAAVTEAYSTYFRDANTMLTHNAAQASAVLNEFRTELVIPTTSTSILVSSARNILEFQAVPQAGREQSPFESTRVRVYSEQYIDISAKLESHLSPLEKRFVNKWHGAWQTLFSQSEDRYCQAIHSGRELLIQLLECLAPNDRFTKEDLDKYGVKTPTHRMQVKYILGDSKKSVDWVDRMAAAIDSMYDILTAESHSRDDSSYEEDTATSLLLSLGALLLFILKKRINRPSS